MRRPGTATAVSRKGFFVDVSVIVPLYNNEKFIAAALDSALDQGVAEIEVIVVDDGSTDDGARVVANYMQEHHEVRLISQPNNGVSAARNNGLDHATGTFVAFLDSDDAFRPGALGDMLTLAQKRNADLVVGESRSVGVFKTDNLVQSKRLSNESLIPRDSHDLVYNFSNCNKLFRKSVIDEHRLRYRRLRHAEDGLFLYEFVSVCGLITGCPRYVYEYNKRLSLDARSALKSLDGSMFHDAMTACTRIADLTREWPEEFRDELNTRILRVTVIGEYYRRLWTLDDGLLSTVLATADQYRALVGEDRWRQIAEMNTDLRLGDRLPTREDVLAAPLVSVVVPEGLEPTTYLDCLSTLYFQLCPSFEVLVSRAYEGVTPDEYMAQANLSFFDGDALAVIRDTCKGSYVHIVCEGCVYNEDSMRRMAVCALASPADFVSVRPMAYRDGRGMVLPQAEEVFCAKSVVRCQDDEGFRSQCNMADRLVSNKLFKREPLIELLGHLEDPSLDGLLSHAYQDLTCERLPKVVMGITTGIEGAVPANPVADGMPRSKKKAVGKAATKAIATRRRVYAMASRLLPVNRKKVLFLSDIRASLGGNYEPIKPVLEERGFEVVELFQPTKDPSGSRKKQARLGYELATAGLIVLEDFYGPTADITVRKGQELVQLWHACGAYKKFAWSRAGGNEGINIHPGYRKYTKAIVSAEAIRKDYADAYRIDIDKVRATGIPRTDVFFEPGRPERIRASYEKKYPLLRGKRVVLIAPTYRGATVGRASYDIERLGLRQLHERLGDEYVFVTKWHPAMQEHLKKMERTPSQREKWQKIHDEFEATRDYVLDLSGERDINDLLMCCDVLVTDYSSVIFEYALMNKPIVYFWYDVNAYILGRGTYYDMDEYVYGNVAYRTEDLADAIAANDLCEDRRAGFIEKFMSACDGHSAERTVDWMVSSAP